MGLALINFSKNTYPYHRYACGLCFFSVIYLSALILKPRFYQISSTGLASTFIRVPADLADPAFYHPKRLCIRKVMINENNSNSPE
jgi:hypothetical protein